MAKFHGTVGFASTVETAPGVWKPTIEERTYSGDFVSNYSMRWEQKSQANDDLGLNQRVSILSDPYMNEHFSEIRYIVYRGAKWKVTNVEVQFPRLALTIGTLYNQ